MLVVDASAAVDVVVGASTSEELAARIGAEPELAAPHLVDVEVLHSLRRMVRLGWVGLDRAVDLRADFEDLPLTRFSHEPLADRVWALRDSLSAYDATYLALAEIISIPLITCDAALASVAERTADVELYPRTD